MKLLLAACLALAAQTLPPAEQAYERFRAWVTKLPADRPRGPELMPRYREYLRSQGLTDAEASAQIQLVETQGDRAEIARWNRILTAEKPSFNTAPNEFLTEMAKDRTKGAALDVGMGQGRNAIWLAQQGWDVTGFDPAEKAVELARATAGKLGVRLRTEIKGVEDFEFGERRWDLILLSYVGAREFADKVERALKPGGVIIAEAFHRDATRNGPIGEAVVFDTGELPKLFPQLRVVRYEEPVRKADFGRGEVRVVRYCGVRPE